MDTVKKAIISALEKGDANDRSFREKVYRQTFAALDRSLKARPDLPAEEVERQRAQVKAAVVEIERGFLAPPVTVERPPAPEAGPRPDLPAPEAAAAPQAPEQAPGIEHEMRPGFAEGPEFESLDAGEARIPLAGRQESRSPLVMLVLAAVLVAVIGLGIWWTVLRSPSQSDPAPPSPQPGVAEEENSNAGAPVQTVSPSAQEEDWLVIFSPDDPTTVSAPAGTTAEAMSSEDESFLRISTPATSSTAVSFDVGQGTLEQLAGRRAVFSLTARHGEEEGETQISISCDFGALGGCGRTRYLVGGQPSEYLFEVQLPDIAPQGGGTISIVPDIEGRGRVLDVFSLQVTTDEQM